MKVLHHAGLLVGAVLTGALLTNLGSAALAARSGPTHVVPAPNQTGLGPAQWQ
jgi:hypothetical protein